jgi:hypothetical protein
MKPENATSTKADFEQICIACGLEPPSAELEALLRKRQRIAIVWDETKNYWSNFFDDFFVPVQTGHSEIDSTKFSRYIEKVSFNVDGIIHSSCTMLDCLLHVINKTMFVPPLKDSRVTLETVQKRLGKTTGKEIAESLDALVTSDEYRYLYAYDIVSKHRGIVSSNFSLSFEAGVGGTVGSKVNEFVFDSIRYDSIWIEEALERYNRYYGKLIDVLEIVFEQLKRERILDSKKEIAE